MSPLTQTELIGGDSHLHGISNINLIIGKNGSGKSRFLRSIEATILENHEYFVRYISPERAGIFQRDGNIENSDKQNPGWLSNSRRVNQASNFKQASANQLHDIHFMYLQRLQDTPSIREDLLRNFDTDVLHKINHLITNIFINMNGDQYEFIDYQGNKIKPNEISSGESEAIALATEVLYFTEKIKARKEQKFSVLLIDEPDVHLHPDLQARFARFLIQEIEELEPNVRNNTCICIATHSTPMICALSRSEFTTIGTKNFSNNTVHQESASEELKKAAPFFGHPLSLSLSEDVPLIVEGEDDERVLQQAARTAQGKIKLFPILATSVDQQSDLEEFCSKLMLSLYDTPIAYSLRDGDGKLDDLKPVGPVIRYRLNCYAIENLLVTNECLNVMHSNWDDFCKKATIWITENSSHRDVENIKNLISAADRQRHIKIKNIRQLICSILECGKPWEVVVGQALGQINACKTVLEQYSLEDFVGQKAIKQLLAL